MPTPHHMKDWELEAALAALDPFAPETANYELEQYSTSAHLAAQIVLCAARSFGDVEGQVVLDLGCGTGILSCACALAGAARVVGVDVDETALAAAAENLERCGCEADVDLVRADVDAAPPLRLAAVPDICVMNPPFGTRNVGVDARFVKFALGRVSSAVYSLHKSSTRAYFVDRAPEWGASAQIVAELKFDLPKTYKFHRDESRDVRVDLIRFAVGGAALPPPPPPPPGRGKGGKGKGGARGRGRAKGDQRGRGRRR